MENKNLACEMFDIAKQKCLENKEGYLKELISRTLKVVKEQSEKGYFEVAVEINENLNRVEEKFLTLHFSNLGFGFSSHDKVCTIWWSYPSGKNNSIYG